MTKKRILFYTQVYFLDNALEYAKMLSENSFEVHVLINLAESQLKVNVLDLDIDITKYSGVTSFWDINKLWNIEYLDSYFGNCSSVNFAVFPKKNIGSVLKVSKTIKRHIRSINPDYIHLDEFSARHLFILPFLLKQRRKVILNIHDPKLHSGENDKVRVYSRKILFKYIPNFVVFSKHAKKLLKLQLSEVKNITEIKLLPYTVYRKFAKNSMDSNNRKLISFVGRLSPYKGIELFLEAVDLVHQKFPDTKFAIGGKAVFGYQPDFLNKQKANLRIENRFLNNTEMSELIKSSKLIVCPYIDATQSGVIMAAYALNCPVLVTNTGGLPEYVSPLLTGVITSAISSESIAKDIITILESNKADDMSNYLAEDNILRQYSEENMNVLNTLYI